MPEQVRVGVIGTSWWEDMMHLPCLRSHPRASVAALCGRNRTRTEELAKKYGVPRVFTDYRELIEKGGVEALVVASPDDLHYPMVMEAMNAGLNVLCEKPMAYNLKQAKDMCK
jgi:predicted dehydrogenase